MSEQERDPGTEGEREETFEDLDVPQEQSGDITGGKKAEEETKI